MKATLAILSLLLAGAPLLGQSGQAGQPHMQVPGGPTGAEGVRIEQRLGEQVPTDLTFRDEQGRTVTLAEGIGGKPTILVLAYYRCPKLCNEVLNGVLSALRAMRFDVGREFNVLTVSFDPRETPEIAAAKKASYLERYGRPSAEEGWHFLTGEEENITRLAEAVGFHYRYDAEIDQYAHASGIMVLTPEGKVARYFYGVRYSPRDLRFALIEEAGENRIGTPVDQILLLCYHYDPRTGTYTAVMSVMRIAALFTLLTLVGAGLFAWWRGRRKTQASGVA